MSESEKETTVISRVVDGLDHDDDDDDDDAGGWSRGSTEKKRQKQKQQRRGCGCGGDFSKVKVEVLIPCKKAKKLLIRRRTDSNKKPSSSSSSSANADLTGKRVNGSCFCFKRPSTLESPAESITSDPNDPNFTFDMLRTLIENNDFFSKECNPHLDATRSSFSSDNSSVK